MLLTDEQAKEAAARLWQATYHQQLPPNREEPMLLVVRALASELMPQGRTPSPEEESVFMAWMGEPAWSSETEAPP